MKHVKYLFAHGVIFLLIIYSCSESKEDLISKDNISGAIRETNIIFQNYINNASIEDELTIDKVRDYYVDYNKSFSDIKLKLAASNITDEYHNLRHDLDSLLSMSMVFNSNKQSAVLKYFEILDDLSKFKMHVKASINAYKNVDSPSELIRAIGESGLSRVDASQIVGEFQNDKFDLLMMKSGKQLNYDIIYLSKNLNQLFKNQKFVDTLTIMNVLADTNDVIHKKWDKIKYKEITFSDIPKIDAPNIEDLR